MSADAATGQLRSAAESEVAPRPVRAASVSDLGVGRVVLGVLWKMAVVQGWRSCRVSVASGSVHALAVRVIMFIFVVLRWRRSGRACG